MSAANDYANIVEAARQGAEWAWTRLYRDASPTVLRYLRARGAREPEDLLGDVFVQVVRNISRFDGGEAEFRAWVVTIARNRLTDDWRRRGRNPEAAPLDDVLAREEDPAGDAEEDAMRRLADDRVRAVLAGLTPQQRDVMLLRIFGRLTIDEVAAAIGKRPGAVKSIQTRAFAAIRKAISKGA